MPSPRFLEADEVIVLATPVLKRRHLSVKRRQLVLVDGISDGLPSCRLFYVDPDAMEFKVSDVGRKGASPSVSFSLLCASLAR